MIAGNNQLSGYTYDAAGNLLNDGTNSIAYDGENRVISSSQPGQPVANYTYGADGERIGKTVNNVETNYVHDIDGSLLATYVNGGYAGYPQELWLNGKHFGTVVVNSNLTQTQNYALTNWLGSEAARTSVTTGEPSTAFLSQPFGDGQTTLFGSDTDDTHFTGKERDTESGNDYFGARYYSSSIGRFSSPDPSGLEYADPKNPQSLNLYSYVLNNPLHYVGPTGMYCDYSDHNDPASGFDQSQFDYNSNSRECGTNGGQWVNDAYTHNGADDLNRPQYAVSSNTDSGNNPWTLTDFQAMGQAWLSGVLPQQLNYGPWSWESIDMSHNFAVNRARAAYIKAGCPGSGTPANSFAAGHVEAAVDSWGNVVLGQPDYLELQVGGFSGTITGGNDSATFTVTNPMSNSSFNGQSGITGGHSTDNPNGPNGPKHTVMQTFKWTEENLCHQ